METLKLNNTPVRTSRNFGINNIELKDIELPENLKEFKNVEIINEGCSLEKSISNKKLVYGNGKILEENILKNANSSLKIISNSKNSNIKIKKPPFPPIPNITIRYFLFQNYHVLSTNVHFIFQNVHLYPIFQMKFQKWHLLFLYINII